MSKPELSLLYDYVFANTVLPNALINELGIITYLHTLHSNRLEHNGFFEDYPGSVNPLKIIFGDSYGFEPNSLRHNGSHLTAGFLKDYATIKEDSLFYGKKQLGNKKYFYSIKISAHLNNFLNVTNQGGKSFGEFFWKHMSAQSLDDVRKNKAIILIDYLQENYVEKIYYDNLHTVLAFSGIPKDNIIFLVNSFNAQKVYENWYAEGERKITVKGFPFVACNSSFWFDRFSGSCMTETDFKQSYFYHRPNYFLFKIKRPRTQRLAIFYKLVHDNLLEKGDWSFIEPHDFNEIIINQISRRFNCELNIEKIREVYTLLPHNLQSEHGKTHEEVSAWTDRDMTAHKNSYFYICTETFTGDEYGKDYKSLTEKVFKPIANFQPFVFFAFPKALKLLRDLGFKTFHPFIDESYDDEEDIAIRFQKMYREIERLTRMDKDEIHAWYWSMQDILVYNHYHLKNFYKNQPYCVDFINFLNEQTKL